MRKNFMSVACRLAIGAATVALLPASVFAQAAGDDESDENAKEIIVTGTLIRGVAAPGASPITVSDKAIKESGASTVAQLLQTVPQLGSFANLSAPSALSPEVSVNRPNLRDLPGFNTGGGSTTLVLIDGHRVVGMGSASTTPDPDIIPAGVIERLEIVPDGGSAIYGSDAVAGVLNFITIKRFDGVKVDASYGFGKNYYRYNANVTAGRDWGSGSIFASYNYAKGDELVGIDRDYIRQFPDTATGLTELGCSPGNVQVGVVNRAQPGGAAGTFNQCDNSDYQSLAPAYKRHSVFAGLTQELSDSIKIEIRAFYTKRDTQSLIGPYRFSASLTAAQATTLATAPFNTLGAQTVFGQFGANDAQRTDISLETFGITPTITAKLGENFQLRVLASHGESIANTRGNRLDTTALANLITSGAFNPYNPSAATAETQALLTNQQLFAHTRQFQDNARAVIDGDLFNLPGGAVKVAVGLEYTKEKFKPQNGTTVPGFQNTGFTPNGINSVTSRIPIYDISRSVKSAFGELVAPILGGGSGPELTVSVAGRYDDYSDVGSTFNPRFGATFKPVEWISIRGAWSKSFVAPSLADDQNAASTDVFLLSSRVAAGRFAPPADLVTSGAYPAYSSTPSFVPGIPGRGAILAIRGNAPGITPQKADTWSLGFDVEPPFIPGLSFGATYFNIDYKDFIGLPPFQDADALYRFNGNVIRTAGQYTQADINAIVASDTDGIISGGDPRLPNGINPFGGIFGNATVAGTYAIFDARKRNLGAVKLDGVDFRANYRAETGFGALYANLGGTYDLSRKQKPGALGPFLDQLSKDRSRLRARTTVGAEVGNLQAQVTWSHLAGYDFSSPQGFNGTAPGGQVFTSQTSIAAFNTFDLFFRYDVKGSGIGSDLAFTLNVENAFDQDPPEFRGFINGAPGVRFGSTIGRFVTLGVTKKF